jgi:tetratricopeptide (TPR) repeat protein
MADSTRCLACSSNVPPQAAAAWRGSCPWCLAVVDVLTPVLPAPRPQLPQEDRRGKPVLELAPGTPPELASIIEKCLAFKPDDRYGTFGEISAEIRRFRKGQPVDAHSRGALYRGWKYLARRRIAAAAIIVAVAIGGVLLAIEAERYELAVQREAAVWTKLGDERLDAGDDAGAREAFTQALVLSPSPRTFRLRSFASYRLLDYAAAVADAATAIALEPTFSGNFIHRASILSAMGNSEEAKADERMADLLNCSRKS